ncbi:MAG TPA: c-type cytochrome [Lacunisphaera sp.]|nr:c-type cytochrome [Lacunisphaera sp.]
MKRILKFLGWAVLASALLVAGAIVAVYAFSARKLGRRYAVSVQVPAVPSDPGAVARGRHIAETRGCADCHGADLGGAKVIDDPAMGRLYGPNLTRGQGGVPANLADADWVRAIRHGVARDGHGLFLMPSADYSTFTDEDLGDLIAYLRSVPPVNRASVPVSVGPVARALLLAGKIQLAADVIDHAAVRPEVVKPGVTVAYGRYLAIGCTGCHGPNFSGGKIDIGPPDWPPAQNLTPAGDLAKWSEEDFIRTMRDRVRPDGTKLSEVMPAAFGKLNDTEMKALWAFLRTLPAAATGSRPPAGK